MKIRADVKQDGCKRKAGSNGQRLLHRTKRKS